MSEHTAGPWHVTEEYRPQTGNHIYIETASADPRRETVTVAEMVDDPIMGDGAPTANARLIAAAPELLIAAKAGLRALRAINEQIEGLDLPLADIEAAIAKAEGKRLPITSIESQTYIDTGELPDIDAPVADEDTE